MAAVPEAARAADMQLVHAAEWSGMRTGMVSGRVQAETILMEVIPMKKQQCDEQRNMTNEEWLAEGERLFGKYYEDWKFKCPRCGNVASGQEFKALGINPNAMYCECIGRHTKGKGCDWAAYGFFDICTVHVDGNPVFEFAPDQEVM